LKRQSIYLLLAISMISCGEEESDESKRFETLKNIDTGNFDQAITSLSNCKEVKGFTEEECLLNRGMSYFGKAGYDLIEMGEELYTTYIDENLSDNERDNEVLSILIDKFENEDISKGVEDYKSFLALNNKDNSICTRLQFDDLLDFEQQACLAINPMLLLEVLDGDVEDGNEKPVDIEDLIFINNSLSGIAPNFNSNDLAKIMNGEELSEESQKELWATNCMIIPENCSQFNLYEPEFIKTEGNLTHWKIEGEDGSSLLRITDLNEKLVLIDDINGVLQARLSEKGVQETFNSEVIYKMNYDKEFLTSIALSIDLRKDISSEEKVQNFKTDVCGSSSCEITDENLINYLTDIE
jgi:hypothetical protein